MPETSPLPPWPDRPPADGPIRLRRFRADDIRMIRALATDPYIPLIGTLPAYADDDQAREWIERQHHRHAEGAGFSFAVALDTTDEAVGGAGLWLRELPSGRAHIGYSIAPAHRRHGYAAAALRAATAFGWTFVDLHRIELYVEPWNTGSLATAAAAGYQREGLLRRRQEIGGERRDMVLLAALRP